MSVRKRKGGNRGKSERGKNLQMKQEIENISFKFYLQGLVLVKTEMQILELLTLYLQLFLLQIFFLLILAGLFFVF